MNMTDTGIGEQHAVRLIQRVKTPSLESRAMFPAARTAATHALVVINVSNKAVNGTSVDGEGADDVSCTDDAPVSAAVK